MAYGLILNLTKNQVKDLKLILRWLIDPDAQESQLNTGLTERDKELITDILEQID